MIELGWPYFGLTTGVVILVLLFTALRRGAWRDPRWLALLLFAAYLVHQFEEYGIAATGEHHAFPAELCAVQGFEGTCPVPVAGLLTAALVFIPLALWSAIAARGRGVTRGTLVIVALGGTLQHAVLFGSVRLFIEGVISEPVLVGIQLANALVAIGLVAGWERLRRPAR